MYHVLKGGVGAHNWLLRGIDCLKSEKRYAIDYKVVVWHKVSEAYGINNSLKYDYIIEDTCV